MSAVSKNQSFLKSLGGSQDGSITPLFGLCVVALMMMAGIAVDSARGTRIASEAGVALDAAALAAAKSLRLDNPNDEQLLTIARTYFNANFDPGNTSGVGDPQISALIDRHTNGVTLTANIQMPTTLSAILGEEHMDISTTSAAVYDVRNVELSMMLDVSGSMAGSRIADLKTAASELVEILLQGNETGGDHKIAIAPFSTAVNGGTLANIIGRRFDSRGRPYAGAYTTCMTDRSGTLAFSDADPESGRFNMRSNTCPTSTVLPLSDDRDALLDHIENLSAAGMTAGHLGISWAWYLLSPEWSDILPSDSAPKAYDEKDYQKVAILMTDGMFNTSYESANGNSEQQARTLCTNMKGQGLTVYTVGFQVPPEVLPILQHCATSPMHFFDAKNGAELSETFRTIAKRLSGLRLAS
jgi:Flp pilus assembly protein TadG